MDTSLDNAQVIKRPRLALLLAAVALYVLQIATWECHFCFYFRTPIGVTSLLLPATLLLWLKYPGYILSMALSILTFGLAAQNVANRWRFAIEDYGPRWFGPTFKISWGYLLAMGLSVFVVWYVVASLWQRSPRP